MSIDEIIKEHGLLIKNLCLKMLPDHDLGIEAYSDVCFKIYNDLDKYDPAVGTLRSWISRITKNHCIDVMRREKRNTDHATLDSVVMFSDKKMNPIYRNEVEKIYNDLLDSLPPNQKIIMKLRFQENIPLKEIASLLDISIGTVKTQLFRGIQKMREVYKIHCYC